MHSSSCSAGKLKLGRQTETLMHQARTSSKLNLIIGADSKALVKQPTAEGLASSWQAFVPVTGSWGHLPEHDRLPWWEPATRHDGKGLGMTAMGMIAMARACNMPPLHQHCQCWPLQQRSTALMSRVRSGFHCASCARVSHALRLLAEV